MLPIVTILRHGEKELGGVPPYGVNIDGQRDLDSLTVRGWQRAGALVALMSSRSDRHPAGLPTPTHLFASAVGETANRSARPRETLEPLSQCLGVAIDQRFFKAQIDELAAGVRACAGAVLIAWEHKMIPLLAAALMGDPASIPTGWPDDRYDVSWIFEPDPSGERYRFRQAPQLLLAGDLDTPI